MSQAIDQTLLRRTASVAWRINRPYFDLGIPEGSTPLHACHVLVMFDWLQSGDWNRPGPNMGMTGLFRSILVEETGLEGYAAAELTDLPGRLRTESWDLAAELAANADALSDRQRIGLARLLCALTFYPQALRVLSRPPVAPRNDEASAGLVALRLFVLYIVGGVSRDELLADVRRSLREMPAGGVARCSLRMLWLALVGATVDPVDKADELGLLHTEITAAKDRLRADDWCRLRARGHCLHAKVVGTVDHVAGLAQVAAAEEACAEIHPAERVDELLRDEAVRRVLDRTCLLHLLAGDVASAWVVADRAARLDPDDSKAWLQLGNVHFQARRVDAALRCYRTASVLGPLYTGQALFLAGQCLERLDHPAEAVECYVLSLKAEPTGVSAALALVGCATRAGLNEVAAAARAHSAALDSIRRTAAEATK